MVNEENNMHLQVDPILEELKSVVFCMNPNSTAGPDDMNGHFFQVCWNINQMDLMRVIQSFFSGHNMPKIFT